MNRLSRFIGILSHWHIGTLFLVTLFFSCAGDDSQPGQPGNVTTGRAIRREITAKMVPMESAEGEGATRATTEVPLSEYEAKMHELMVLQFSGTEPGSKLIKKTKVDVSEINQVTGTFFFDFEELAGGGDSKVYLAANCDGDLPVLTVNTTTLGEFESSAVGAYPWTEDNMKSYGLPMLASQSFDVAATNPAPFKLKSLLAKVVFSFDTARDFVYKSGILYYENLAGAVPVIEHTPGSAAWHPAEIGFSGEGILIDGDEYTGEVKTMYIPENMAGQMSAITKDSDRGGKPGTDVPADASYILLSTDGLPNGILGMLDYQFYLGDGTPQDFNVVRHHQYTMHVTLRGANAADKRVTLKTANCYVVNTSNTTYSFLATVMGNGAITPAAGANAPEIVPTPLRPSSAKVLWEQSDPTGKSNAVGDVIKQGSVSTDGTYITFTIGAKPGNAVIGAFDDAGKLIWSWHIWHPADRLGDVTCHTTGNGGRDFRMMSLNLGAFNNNVNDVGAYGLHYQWGRKDPFPNATEVTYDDGDAATFGGVVTGNGYSFAAVQTSTGITVQGGVQTPMNFYYDENGDHNTDWLQNLNDNLWGTPYTNSSVPPNPDLGSKSIYDPCPVGYRVPPQDTWSQATAANSTWATNGYQLGVGTGSTPTKYFYPAAGVRWGDSDVGKLANVGSNGYYWSSSPYSGGDSAGGGLSFYDGGMYSVGYRGRAYGMSVRCMKEE